MTLVKAVLFFGSETWVVTPRLEKALTGFHHRVVWRMAGMGTKFQLNGKWVYPTIGVVLVMVVLEEIGVFITHRQNTVAQYISNCPIMDLFLAAEQRPGVQLSRRWWYQNNLDILGMRVLHAAAEMGEYTGTEESEEERD